MSAELIAAVVFLFVLACFLWFNRSRVVLQSVVFPLIYFLMYRSSFGIRSMGYFAGRFPRILNFVGIFGVIVGFVGMIAASFGLVWTTVRLFISPIAAGIQLVLPVDVKGVFFVPFSYWILSIFVLAIVHEFSHGVLARLHNVPVKSSGFAFLCLVFPIVPAAFVEPDERVLRKKPFLSQLSVFAAGPFSNGVFSVLMLGLFFVLSPVLLSLFVQSGLEVVSSAGPAFDSGIRSGDVLVSVNNASFSSFAALVNSSSSGDALSIGSLDGRVFSAVLGSNPNNASMAYLGVSTMPYLVPTVSGWFPHIVKWFAGFVFWLFILNFGIGLFNLLPIGPLDGGRMFQLVCFKLFKKKPTALKVWHLVSLAFFLLILVNLVAGFVL